MKGNLKVYCFYFLLLVCISGLVSACKIYSFNPGSSGDAKTISIKNFINQAGNGPPNLTQNFSEKLRSYYQQNTRLEVVPSNGDWQLEGRFTGYSISPVAPTAVVGNQQAGASSLNRLTIRVQVKFTNVYYEQDKTQAASFEQEFSFYADFPQTQSLSAVEPQLNETILNQIVLDVFTKTMSNW